MKIRSEEKTKKKPREQKVPGAFSMTTRRLVFIQIMILLLAFLAGAAVYRSGVLRPLTLFIRNPFVPQAIKDGPLAEVGKNVEDELRLYQENGLPTLYIDLKFKYYQQLLAKREEAINIGVLQTTDADFVPAAMQLQNGPKLDTKMRLKGDWTDHLRGDKWSFRVHVKGGEQILHFTQFSIQGPETRNYLNEWAFHRNLLNEGILTTRYSFVNALLNGKLLGIYAIEEHFAPELIESQGRRQGVIIRFDENLYWDNVANFWGEGIFADGGTWMVTNGNSADITSFQASKIALDPTLSAEAETARAMLRAFQTGQRPASEVFDVDLMGRYFALSDLWAACHGIDWHNWRFYYNPVNGLLEPVAFDNVPLDTCLLRTSISQRFIESGMFDDPQIRTAYARELARITQKGYIEKLYNEIGAEGDQLAEALQVEFPSEDVAVDWLMLQDRIEILALELQPAQPARGSYQASGVNQGDITPPQLNVDLVNLMILPIDVLRFEVNGTSIIPTSGVTTLAPVMDPRKDSFNPARFTLPLSNSMPWDDANAQVVAIVRLTGLLDEFSVPLTGATTPEGLTVGPLPANPTLDEALAKYPFLSVSPDLTMLLVSPGTWDVRGDLIIPEGVTLQVSPGTILRFDPGAILLARGAVNINGTASDPVLFTAQQDGWGGIIVIGAENESTWKYVKVEKTFGISRSGWILTGGITFFKSDIRLEHAILGNNQTEDAINPIHSKFTVIDSEFENTFADAIDADFCEEVKISGSYFHDIAGDAIDVSGTTITISDTRMERITDKGVSVGEASTATIRNVTMDIVGIGIASKDLSKAYVYQTSIAHARFSALAAYIKKPVYGPAYIEAPDLIVTDSEREAIVQIGSTILLRGQTVPGVQIDVDKLYSEGILGN